MVLTITGYQFSTAQEAVQFAEADEAQAIRINGKNIVVSKAEASRLESLGVRFSYLLTDGANCFKTVPVRHTTN